MAIVGRRELKATNDYLRKEGVDVQGATDRLGYKLPGESSLARVLAFMDGK